jgi:hypothetical protein
MLSGWKSNAYYFPNKTSHTSKFFGQDTGVIELDVVTQVYAVVGHSSFLHMIKLNMLMDKVECADGALGSRSQWNAQFVQHRTSHTLRKCYMCLVFSSRGHPLQGKGNWSPSWA